MEIILSNRVEAITGELGSGFGYHIQHRKNGFFTKRNSKGIIPPDGHWRFIVTCAKMAQNGLYLSDIQVSREEVQAALKEAGLPLSGARDVRHELNAADILSIASECHSDIKKEFGL